MKPSAQDLNEIYEIGYRIQQAADAGHAAAKVAGCHDGIRADAELDIGV